MRRLLLGAVMAALVAGCGGGDDGSTGSAVPVHLAAFGEACDPIYADPCAAHGYDPALGCIGKQHGSGYYCSFMCYGPKALNQCANLGGYCGAASTNCEPK